MGRQGQHAHPRHLRSQAGPPRAAGGDHRQRCAVNPTQARDLPCPTRLANATSPFGKNRPPSKSEGRFFVSPQMMERQKDMLPDASAACFAQQPLALKPIRLLPAPPTRLALQNPIPQLGLKLPAQISPSGRLNTPYQVALMPLCAPRKHANKPSNGPLAPSAPQHACASAGEHCHQANEQARTPCSTDTSPGKLQ